MNELHSRTNADLMQVATSKDYGKSTRSAARAILAERGVAVDEQRFENPSPGFIPATPGTGENKRVALKIISFVLFVLMLTAAKMMFRY